MYLSEVENIYLRALFGDWIQTNSVPQEAFDWTRSKAKWQTELVQYSNFITQLPNAMNRLFLREIVADTDISLMEKFLTIMIWGYGDLGYGPYRVNKMISSPDVEEKISQVFNFCQNAQPLLAYEFLAKHRVNQLGPAFGTKLVCFFSPREIVAPIYDSFVWRWMELHAKDVFENGTSSSEVWNIKVYTKYLNWMKFHVSLFNCYSDDLELVIFRDALSQFSSNSSWEVQ